MGQLRYSRLNSQHPICSWRAPSDMPVCVRRFYRTHYMSTAAFAQVVKLDDQIIAFLRYDISNDTFYALGTYVLPNYRGLGLCKELWRRALLHVKPKTVKVNMTSRGAGKLIRSLKKKYPKIDFKAVRAYS